MGKGEGWECGIFTQRHIEWLHKIAGEMQAQIDSQKDLIEALRKPRENDAVAVKIPTSAEKHEDMLSSMAHHLSTLSESDRDRVIGMARAWAVKHAYAQDLDPVKHLASEVSKLNGYALGAFMQYLMEFGSQHQRIEIE